MRWLQFSSMRQTLLPPTFRARKGGIFILAAATDTLRLACARKSAATAVRARVRFAMTFSSKSVPLASSTAIHFAVFSAFYYLLVALWWAWSSTNRGGIRTPAFRPMWASRTSDRLESDDAGKEGPPVAPPGLATPGGSRPTIACRAPTPSLTARTTGPLPGTRVRLVITPATDRRRWSRALRAALPPGPALCMLLVSRGAPQPSSLG